MDRLSTQKLDVKPLLKMIEQRFDLSVSGPIPHLRAVQEHYRQKRELLLAQYGESEALLKPDYAKAFLISEAARMMVLREIQPRPKKKRKK